MTSDISSLIHQEPILDTNSTTALGKISEVASFLDIDSLSLSSNSGQTPTSSSSSFKTLNTTSYHINYPELITKKPAVLAEAEFIDDDEDEDTQNLTADDAEFVDNETETSLNESVNVLEIEEIDKKNNNSEQRRRKVWNSLQQNDASAATDSESNFNKKINDIKQSLITIGSPSLNLESVNKKSILLPLEKVSNEAREYWATLDLYNNSKVAFNKRSKSVQLKREKLNNELESRLQVSTPQKQYIKKLDRNHLEEPQATPQQKHDPETCKCVRCTIDYHESIIKSVSDMKSTMCRKCSSKIMSCKCSCSSSSSMSFSEASSVGSSIEESKKTSDNVDKNESKKSNKINIKEDKDCPVKEPKKQELNRFEEKLFNIKNELVNLSETSLDVFQLLLQLSDTMLELNSQLNSNNSLATSKQNSNQLLFINQLLNSSLSLNENFDLSKKQEIINKPIENNNSSDPKKPHNRRIEDFLQKTLNSVQSSSNTSFSNKINRIKAVNQNLKNNNTGQFQIDSIMSSPSKYLHDNNSYILNSKRDYANSSPPELTYEPLIDNLYDKTSVTQFVDSFFNNNSNNISNKNSSEEVNSRSSGYYSLLSTLNKNSHYAESDFIVYDNPYQSIDDDLMSKVENLAKNAKANSNSFAKYQVIKDSRNKQNSTSDSMSIMSDAISVSSSTQSSSLNRSSSTQQKTNNNQNTLTNISQKSPSHHESNSTSSNSSSIGCMEGTGSVSIGSSSNIDLSSLPSTSSSSTNITSDVSGHLPNSTTTNSLVLNESQTMNRRHLKNNKDNDFNKVTDNLIQSYRLHNNETHKINNVKSDNTKKSIIPELPLTKNSIGHNLQNDPLYGSSSQYNTRSNSYKSSGNANIYQSVGSTRRKPSFKFDSNILNRVQTMGLGESINNRHDSIDEMTEVSKTKSDFKASYKIRFGDKSNHQMSIDSGIYLPSECEEINYNSMNRS